MQFLVMRPEHPDYPRQVARLAAAFTATDAPTDEYTLMCQRLDDGTLSLYHVTGDSLDLSIVGEVIDDSYFVWAVAGKGFRTGVTELIKRVKGAGFKSVTCATAKPGIRRMYRYFRDLKLTETEQLNNGCLCTWHELEV
ncbi:MULTISPECIES: hypothetical protein [Photobacterium]|nr:MULTISPECIES: hypothetical protein [Photobacterium]MBV1843613.1 hypothetical protein [Photobacterium ganghwense]